MHVDLHFWRVVSDMANLVYHPDFSVQTDELHGFRVSFQFTVSGDKQSGVSYVNMNIPVGELLATIAQKACDKACKRAGTNEATLWRVTSPVNCR